MRTAGCFTRPGCRGESFFQGFLSRRRPPLAKQASVRAHGDVFTRSERRPRKVLVLPVRKWLKGLFLREARSMIGKFLKRCVALVLAAVLVAPALVRADPCGDCPGSSYSACHYNFPLLWRGGAHLSFHWHAPPETPPPFSA